jgi:hypothetical protein
MNKIICELARAQFVCDSIIKWVIREHEIMIDC